MGSKISDELVSTVRSIVGPDFSYMDIIRALHLAKNDATAAINIIYDTPSSFSTRDKPRIQENSDVANESKPVASTSKRKIRNEGMNSPSPDEVTCSRSPCIVGDKDAVMETSTPCSSSIGSEWWLVGCAEVAGLSTSKGRKVKPGDGVVFMFPSRNGSKTPLPAKVFGKGRHMANFSEIVRFSTKDSGEVICLVCVEFCHFSLCFDFIHLNKREFISKWPTIRSLFSPLLSSVIISCSYSIRIYGILADWTNTQ